MVSGIIVLFNPDVLALERLLNSLIGQVSMIYAVDNTTVPSDAVLGVIAKFSEQLTYIGLGENLGIAAAQNIGIKRSIEAGFSHVLLLDQDSALPPGMVEQLLAAEAALLRSGELVAAVGPQFIDEKNGKQQPVIRHRPFWVEKLYPDTRSTVPVETDHMIASGSIIRTSVLLELGMMRADFFIDWVDIEWVLRAKSMGYKTYYVPNVVMKHSVGDSVVNILGRDVHVHSDLRNYYMLRNAIYLFRLSTVDWKWKINFFPRIPCYCLLYPLLSKNKKTNFRFVVRALWDGLCGKTGKFQEEGTALGT